MTRLVRKILPICGIAALVLLSGCSAEKKAAASEKTAKAMPGIAAITPQAAKAAGIQVGVAGPAEFAKRSSCSGPSSPMARENKASVQNIREPFGPSRKASAIR